MASQAYAYGHLYRVGSGRVRRCREVEWCIFCDPEVRKMAVEKKKAHLDRRTFLRNSGVVAGMAAMAPFAALNATADPSRFGARDDSFKPAPQDGGNGATTAERGVSMSRQLARWVAALRYEDLPAAVVDRVKGLTLQALSSALLGSKLPAGKEALRLMLEEEAGVRN